MNPNKFFSKSFTFLIIAFPVLRIYGNEYINLGILFTFFLIFLLILIKQKVGIRWPKYFWLYFIYMFLTRIFFNIGFGLSSFFSFSLIFFSIVIGLSGKYFNLKYGIRLYEILVLISSCFFFLQEIMYLKTGYRVVGLLPWLPININNTSLTTPEFINLLRVNPRSASFFTEPAHFAKFIIPLLAIELFRNKGEKVINFYVVLISVVLLMLRSGTGILLMILIWTAWFFYYLRNSNLRNKLIFTLIIIPGIIVSANFYLNSTIGESMTRREREFDQVGAHISAYVRVIRGFNLFAEYPTLNKWLGINSPSKIKSFISKGRMYSQFGQNDLSFSGIQSILIYGGIIGMLLFLIHFSYLIKVNSVEGRIVAIVLIGLSLIAPVYLKSEMILSYSFIYAFQQQYLLEEKIIYQI